MSSVFCPRRASAAARLIAVVVLPTPPFWLTIARTCPTLLLGLVGDRFAARSVSSVSSACRTQRSASGPDGGLRGSLEVLSAPGVIAALEQEEREPVVRARQLRVELERAPIAADRLFRPMRLVNAIAMFCRIFVSFG